MKPSIYVLGAGGHSKVLIDALKKSDTPVQGVLDSDPRRIGTLWCAIPILGTDAYLENLSPHEAWLVNGLGGTTADPARADVFKKWSNRGFRFASVIHPSAIVAEDVHLGEGVQIMAGAIVQPGCTLGDDVIVNTGARIDHDCRIGDHVHIAPGAVLSGTVTVGERSHLGTGAVVIQGLGIGKSVLVAAGSVVVRSLPNRSSARGVPARPYGPSHEEKQG